MPRKAFKKSFLREMLDSGGVEDIHVRRRRGKRRHVNSTRRRWVEERRLVFESEGRHYAVDYTVGLTEMQDETPFEFDPPEIVCEEVWPVQKTVTVWVPVNQLAWEPVQVAEGA
jgi:hypothetical protein